jgi:hypothetical protein
VTTNEYGNSEIKIGVGYTVEGVQLYVPHPVTGRAVLVLTVEPEFARRIAESFTLRSFECEDARREEM